MPIYLTAQAKFRDDDAREALKAYGVTDPKQIASIWDLDNTDPEHIKLEIMPGSWVVDALGAVFHLAMVSGHKVSTSANGLNFTADPLDWQKKADRKRVEKPFARS